MEKALQNPFIRIRMLQTGNARPCEKFRILLCAKVQIGELWPANLHHVIPCDQQQIDTSQHDLVTKLKEHKFKTAAPQESGVDCKLEHFRCIIICYALNLSF